jgi:secreted trypsin-like serine protease
MKVYLNATNRKTCVDAFEDEMDIIKSQICAGGVRGKDTCRGDSGGPIQTAHRDATCVYDIIGLKSFGSPMCGSTNFEVYTKVSSYLDWIEEIVWKKEYEQWIRDGRKMD